MTDDRLGEIRKYATDPMARIALSMAYPAEIVSLLRELLDEIEKLRAAPVVDGQGGGGVNGDIITCPNCDSRMNAGVRAPSATTTTAIDELRESVRVLTIQRDHYMRLAQEFIDGECELIGPENNHPTERERWNTRKNRA